MGNDANVLMSTKPGCVLGVIAREPESQTTRFYVGQMQHYDPETRAVTLSQHVIFDDYEYKVSPLQKEPKTLTAPDKFLLGPQLLESVRGLGNMSAILDVLDYHPEHGALEARLVQLKEARSQRRIEKLKSGLATFANLIKTGVELYVVGNAPWFANYFYGKNKLDLGERASLSGIVTEINATSAFLASLAPIPLPVKGALAAFAILPAISFVRDAGLAIQEYGQSRQVRSQEVARFLHATCPAGDERGLGDIL